MPLSRRLRYEVLRRDGHRCRYCGVTAAESELTVDHVIPTALGGQDVPENLATACRDCNSGKSSTSPTDRIVADVARDALRLRRAMQAMAYEAEMDRVEMRANVGDVSGAWDEWRTAGGETVARPGDWQRSIERFISLGLTVEDLADIIDRAMSNRRIDTRDHGEWRYMCGIAWGILKDRQQRAAQLLEIERVQAEQAEHNPRERQ